MIINLFKLIIIIVYLISPGSVYSIEHPNLKNIIFHKEPKKLDNIEFKNSKNEIIKISDFKNKLIILNFWATWCLPCREEMPSLDNLSNNPEFKNLQIFPINVGSEKITKSKEFFYEYKIKNLQIYQDNNLNLPKQLLLRGIPTTLLINKDGDEFARILGAVDFSDKKLIRWLATYD